MPPKFSESFTICLTFPPAVTQNHGWQSSETHQLIVWFTKRPGSVSYLPHSFQPSADIWLRKKTEENMDRINQCLKGTNRQTTQPLTASTPALKALMSDQTCSGLEANPMEAELHFPGMLLLMYRELIKKPYTSVKDRAVGRGKQETLSTERHEFLIENEAWQNESRKPRKEQVCNAHFCPTAPPTLPPKLRTGRQQHALIPPHLLTQN